MVLKATVLALIVLAPSTKMKGPATSEAGSDGAPMRSTRGREQRSAPKRESLVDLKRLGPMPQEVFAEASRALENIETVEAALRDLVERAPEVSAMASVLKARHPSSTVDWRPTKLTEEILNQYPALRAGGPTHPSFDDFEAKTIQAKAGESLKAYERRRTCFLALTESQGTKVPESCLTDVMGCYRHVGWDSGGLFHYEIHEGYRKTKVRIAAPGDLFHPSPGIFDGSSARYSRFIMAVNSVGFASCRIASILEEPLEPEEPELRWSDGVLDEYSDDEIRRECGHSPDPAEAERLSALIDEFPKCDLLRTVAVNRATLKPEACRKVAQRRCAAVSEVRGTWVLAYVTAGCRVRSVTADDVRADVRRWGVAATEADRQEHLLFADTIELCRAISAAGYSWLPDPPRVPSDCARR